jgi:kanamycin nucleotidyltransferase
MEAAPMLSYPTATTREEKLTFIRDITDKLLTAYPNDILAIGAYGSLGKKQDLPYSDIEMHVITKDGRLINGHEFIYGKFKLELSCREKSDLFKRASRVDDSWAIWAGSFVDILAIHDPEGVFEELKQIPLQLSEESIKEVMREFMIWEPYETMGKIRNNMQTGNLDYLPLGAKDLVWQTAKLIGLANKKYYTTRAKTYAESLEMPSRPEGYDELAKRVMAGELQHKDEVYKLCEELWTGLNIWFQELNINYKVDKLPF